MGHVGRSCLCVQWHTTPRMRLSLKPGHLEKGPGPRTCCALQQQRCCKRTCAPADGVVIHPRTCPVTLWGYGESDTRWPLSGLVAVYPHHMDDRQNGRPRTGLYTERAFAPTMMWRDGIFDWTPPLVTSTIVLCAPPTAVQRIGGHVLTGEVGQAREAGQVPEGHLPSPTGVHFLHVGQVRSPRPHNEAAPEILFSLNRTYRVIQW